VEKLRAVPGQRVLYLELPGAPHAFDVFHSVRCEAAIGAINAFCMWVIADDAGPATPAPSSTSGPTTTAHMGPS
jgi:hypothetical protein